MKYLLYKEEIGEDTQTEKLTKFQIMIINFKKINRFQDVIFEETPIL